MSPLITEIDNEKALADFQIYLTGTPAEQAEADARWYVEEQRAEQEKKDRLAAMRHRIGRRQRMLLKCLYDCPAGVEKWELVCNLYGDYESMAARSGTSRALTRLRQHGYVENTGHRALVYLTYKGAEYIEKCIKR